jgi:hypothetical protein
MRILAILVVAACVHRFETIETASPLVASQDDDKAPPVPAADPSLDFKTARGVENHSELRFRFDIAAYANADERAAGAQLYPSHAAFLRAHPGALPSVQTVVTYGKQLDDAIFATVERATDRDARLVAADTLARLLAHRSDAGDEAIVVLAAATSAQAPAELAARITAFVRGFDADPARSRPIGYFAASDELRAIWRRTRMLQTRLSGPAACATAAVIAGDTALAKRYRAIVDVARVLTNPPDSLVTGDCAPHAFLGAAKTVEGALYDRLYPAGAPVNADLMRDLVTAIRSGTVDLAPQPGDGWYQYQEWALETLLVTDRAQERSKIAFTARYQRRLREAFASLLTQHRETHVVHSGSKLAGAVPPPRVPSFRVEPLATVYLRHAQSYVALEAALAPLVPLDDALRAQLHHARDLFLGAYWIACEDLGMRPTIPVQPELVDAAQRWLADLAADPIAAADARVIVPIAQLANHRAKYWVVIGVRETLAGYSYIDRDDAGGQPPADRIARVPLPTEQFVEAESSDVPPTREELRALCDRYRTADAIRAALAAR